MLVFSSLSKKFGNRIIFENFSYVFPKSGIVGLVGQSGSGKSTLLNMIAGLDFDYGGKIFFDKCDISSLFKNELSDFRINNIGYVFQNFNLLNLETVFNNIYMPLDTVSSSSKIIKKTRVNDILKSLGIFSLKNKEINKLSGGEKQRVAIGRAIVNEPQVILCDEPTGNLDVKNSLEIFKLLKGISETTLVIIATHDLELIKNFANEIIEIKNEHIKVKRITNKTQSSVPLIMGSGRKSKHYILPFSFKVRHSIQKNKSKKWRSFIINSMLSLSLTGIGLSLIISDSVKSKINDSFNEILNGNQIIMTSKNYNQNTFSTAYNASKKTVENIASNYNEYFDGIGVNYLVNFEDFFRDENTFSFYSKNKVKIVDSFSTRNINDFQLLKSASNDIFFPLQYSDISDDEVVLGITYEEMVNLCYTLQIKRTFVELGHYIKENNLSFVLNVANNSWEYEDEQIFNVVAVKESPKSAIYHSNPLWNEVVFEEMMLLPSDDDTTHYYPWEMTKIYYLLTKEDPSVFLNYSMYDKQMNDLVFERASTIYNPLICNNSEACKEKRIYAYNVDKFGIDLCDLEIIKKYDENIKNFYITSLYGYSSYGSNILSGFSKNVFVSAKQSLIDQAVDSDTSLKVNENYELNFPTGVVQGNYLNSLGNGVKFSTDFSKLFLGREPRNLNEIVISENLAKELGIVDLPLGKQIIVSCVSNEIQRPDNTIERQYNQCNLSVVGVTKEEQNFLYHNSDWSVSFFRDKIGISNFYLIPTGVVFEFDKNINTEKIAEKLNGLMKKYTFDCPQKTLNESIGSTLDYANTIMIGFSVISIIISSLLLATVILLSVLEGKDEIKLFRYLGIREREIDSVFVSQGLLQGIIAFALSSVELLIIDQIISVYLAQYLNLGLVFSLNFKPVIIVGIISLVLPYFISKLMTFYLRKSKNV